jgi:hypothetical protein
MSQLNEILFQNHNPETQSSESNSFVLAFNNQQIYCKEDPILQKINPSNTLYAVCFRYKDFIEKEKLSEKRRGIISQVNSEIQFVETQYCLCFLTFYPFVRCYLDVMVSMLNEIKFQRVKTYTQRMESSLKVL